MMCENLPALIVLVCGFLFGSISARSVRAPADPFTLEEFFTGTFSSRSFNGSWLTGNSFLYRKGGDVVAFNVETQSSSTFLEASVFENYTGASYTVSNDRQYILLRYNVNSVFRHSTTASFTIYDIANKNYHDIVNRNQTQLAQWAPTGHGLVYVYENNIYYLQHPTSSPFALTNNGIPGVLYNGVPDWVYEEEVLGSGSAIWFSPNGQRLAYASFHDENVTEFSYFIYGKTLYPTVAKLRYPKVGTVNPTVRTYMVNLADTKASPVELQRTGRFAPDDFILYDVVWPTNAELALISSNRIQNQAELVACSLSATCTTEATYESKNGWLEIKIPRYINNGAQRLEILPQQEGDDFYDHLVLTNRSTLSAQTTKRLTHGKFEVTTIYGYDQAQGVIYYGGSGQNGAFSQQHVYAVDLSSSESRCLTCAIQVDSQQCLYAAASFSKDFSYWARVCQGPGPILAQVQSLRNESDIFAWEDNEQLRASLLSKLQPVILNVQVSLANGFSAHARLLLPPGLDQNDSNQKYPAIVNVYGGPNSNQIRDAYSSGFQNYIVTNREYIYIYIDGRGSGRDGQNKRHQIYRHMATVEIEDQIAVTKYLQERFQWIDRARTGIWGWSYGGFATAWVLAQDTENIFHCGLSVAPVTNFILYDSIYTERYMGLPTAEDNSAGYNNTDVTNRVEAFRNKLFFLIHGNADDNVHYQQSMKLARALEVADIPFQQQSYPDENHSLGGVSRHLYHTIDRFWARSFGLPDPPQFQEVHNVTKESV